MALARFLHGGPDRRTGGAVIDATRSYDLFTEVMFGGRRRAAYRRLVNLSGVRPGDDVLDLGCGTGVLTRIVADHVGPSGGVVGLDPSASMLAHARARTRSSSCRYVNGVAERLDFPDGEFDAVVTALVLHHLPVPDRPTTIAEVVRVLRPGGRVLIADFRPPGRRFGRHLVGVAVGSWMSAYDVAAIAPLVRRAGLQSVTEGRVRPWLHYVTAVKAAATESGPTA